MQSSLKVFNKMAVAHEVEWSSWMKKVGGLIHLCLYVKVSWGKLKYFKELLMPLEVCQEDLAFAQTPLPLILSLHKPHAQSLTNYNYCLLNEINTGISWISCSIKKTHMTYHLSHTQGWKLDWSCYHQSSSVLLTHCSTLCLGHLYVSFQPRQEKNITDMFVSF